MPTTPSSTTPPRGSRPDASRSGGSGLRIAVLALWTATIAAALVVIGVVTFRSQNTGDVQPHPGIVAGTPGGVAVLKASASPLSTPAPDPMPSATARPTPEPTPAPTPVAGTPVPTSTPTPVPATPDPATPEPTPVVVAAAAAPDEAVAAFYGDVAAGSFDEAYGRWSERMRETYSRQENLDERFAETASISFEQLYVAEQGDGRAVVQANFVETYDSGSSRRFVGYWELVLVDGRWLLDAPHY